jgi:hypothetical protein
MYWAAWATASGWQDLYPYLGGPEFEEMKTDIESDSAAASMYFMGYKSMASQGEPGPIETVSQEGDAAELKLQLPMPELEETPGVQVEMSSEMTVRMVKLDGAWLVGGFDVHGTTHVSGSVEFSGETFIEEDTPASVPSVRFDELERVPLDEGSEFAISDKRSQATDAIVGYSPAREKLTVNLYAERGLFNFVIRNFKGEPGLYFEQPTLYVVHRFNERGIRCDVRRLDWGERPPADISLRDAAALGKFKASFTCGTVNRIE